MCEKARATLESANLLVLRWNLDSPRNLFSAVGSAPQTKMGKSRTGRSSQKRHQQCRLQRPEPLISTRRDDGLWQSIERDDEELASHLEDNAIDFVGTKTLAVKKEEIADQDPSHAPQQPRQGIITAESTPRTSETSTTLDIEPIRANTPSASHRPPTPTGADLLARVPDHPLPRPGLPTAVNPVPDTPPSPAQPEPCPKRPRGRPRKSNNAPNWNRRRRVRFSDPVLPDPEPQPEPKDTHVFVRLLKVIITDGTTHRGQRQELVWNNRAKGWRLAGERSERNIGDVAELFDDLSGHGSVLRVLLAPTVGRGAREPVEMDWNGARCCFQGVNQDLGTLSVALGEMKDMVRDPWARQFVGYVLG